MKKIKEWEKEFDKFWKEKTCIYGNESKWSEKSFNELKIVISNLLQQTRKEVKEEIIKLKKEQ